MPPAATLPANRLTPIIRQIASHEGGGGSLLGKANEIRRPAGQSKTELVAVIRNEKSARWDYEVLTLTHCQPGGNRRLKRTSSTG